MAAKQHLLPVVCLLLLVAPPLQALQPDEVYDIRRVDILDLAPDGGALIYRLTGFDRDAGEGRATIYLRNLDDDSEFVLFPPDSRVGSVAWRLDGQALAYVQQGDSGSHIWLADPDGANAQQISEEPREYGELVWAPDGSAIAFIAMTALGDQEYLSTTAPPSRTGPDLDPDAVTIAECIGYRHLDAGYRRGRLHQLYVLDVASGRVQRIVDAPLDVRACAWSPCSDHIVFEAKRLEDLGRTLNSDLWVVTRDGGDLLPLTANPGPDTSPRWLLDNRIAYLSHDDPLYESALCHIVTLDLEAVLQRVADGTATESPDATPQARLATDFGNRIWRLVTDGFELYFTGFVSGCIDLFAVNDTRCLTAGGHDYWDVRVAGGRVVFAGAEQRTPSALYSLELDDQGMVASGPDLLLDPNAAWAEQVALYTPVPFTASVDDRQIHGWYILPETAVVGEPLPTVLSIHGGPEWMYGGYFLPEFHVLPEHGYAVIFVNPTGSTGYGLDLQLAIRHDWVGQPASDVLGCLDWAVDQGWADPERLAVMGGSYGGHLAVALTTQTDRFRAAAVDRMTCELVSMWGATDEKWFPEWEFGGRPWDDAAREIYHRNSPFNFVDRVTTPTLISHGMRDYRCLIGQAESWFSALTVQGVPTRFLRFENEGHGIRGSRDLVFYLQELLLWFERYVKVDP
ncbi:MAG: S9 family peptidase [bacterium]